MATEQLIPLIRSLIEILKVAINFQGAIEVTYSKGCLKVSAHRVNDPNYFWLTVKR